MQARLMQFSCIISEVCEVTGLFHAGMYARRSWLWLVTNLDSPGKEFCFLLQSCPPTTSSHCIWLHQWV